MSIPFKLFRIQQIDSHQDKVKHRCDDIDILLAEDEALNQARKEEELCKGKLDSASISLRNAEDSVHQQRNKIENSEASLYGGKIRNPKELEELQNEISSLKRYLVLLEDRLLEAMFSADEAGEAFRNAKIAHDKEKARFVNTGRALTEEKRELQEEIIRLQEEKQAAVNGVPNANLQLYETLRKQRRGVAVSKVENKSCSSCGTILNASLLQAASLPGTITRCETCGRILYSG